MPIGYRIDMAAVNGTAGGLAVRLATWVTAALEYRDGIAKLGADGTAQAQALRGMGFEQSEAERHVYLAGAMAELALVASGDLNKPDVFNYLDATAELRGIGQARG